MIASSMEVQEEGCQQNRRISNQQEEGADPNARGGKSKTVCCLRSSSNSFPQYIIPMVTAAVLGPEVENPTGALDWQYKLKIVRN